MKVAIGVLAKAPVAGQVKTRLAATVGNRAACFFYQQMCHAVVGVAAQVDADRLTVWYTPQRHPFFWELKRRYRTELKAQPPGHLGQRLNAVAKEEICSADVVLLIGADAVGLTVGHFRQAVQQLEAGADVVVAPAGDGGYTLIGLRQTPKRVFQQIPWGSAGVMTATRAQCRSAGLILTPVSPAGDLDTRRDLKAWQQRKGSRFFWHKAMGSRYDGA
ncbi:MAG: TIGR04282 family arsenosugar biosynthesis glycosyltransferase [Gammaproteobacteria bacterium]|nr:TIGR04282 family arsenosugar biosynthesis glycosyltransferase [Gammaproteobacteria bacterium]